MFDLLSQRQDYNDGKGGSQDLFIKRLWLVCLLVFPELQIFLFFHNKVLPVLFDGGDEARLETLDTIPHSFENLELEVAEEEVWDGLYFLAKKITKRVFYEVL